MAGVDHHDEDGKPSTFGAADPRLALGQVGLLAGLILGGNKKEVTFVAKFKDGRKMLATTDSKSFTKMQAATF